MPPSGPSLVPKAFALQSVANTRQWAYYALVARVRQRAIIKSRGRTYANREEILANQTHKQSGLEAEKRVYYTLIGNSKASWKTTPAHRNSKAMALLIKALIDAGTLTQDQLDEILLGLVSRC